MTASAQIPRVGMVATARNHRGLVVSVDPYDTRLEGRLHLIHIEYTDGDALTEDTLNGEGVLMATPRKGHTRSFTCLLEQLDPVRFTQKSELSDAEKKRIEKVAVRRLKSEINKLGRPRRFDPFPNAVALYFTDRERAVSEAFADRAAVKKATARAKEADRTAGRFAVAVLGKRLLSCLHTFAEYWYRFQQGLAKVEAASAAEVSAARRTSDDGREPEGHAQHAAAPLVGSHRCFTVCTPASSTKGANSAGHQSL